MGSIKHHRRMSKAQPQRDLWTFTLARLDLPRERFKGILEGLARGHVGCPCGDAADLTLGWSHCPHHDRLGHDEPTCFVSLLHDGTPAARCTSICRPEAVQQAFHDLSAKA